MDALEFAMLLSSKSGILTFLRDSPDDLDSSATEHYVDAPDV
jgi:hypothetical protein